MKTTLKIIGFIISVIVTLVMIIPMYFWFDVKYGVKEAGRIARKLLKTVYAKDL